MPLNSQESGVFFSVAVKIAGFFLSFVGGIVAATWAIAGKVKGFEDRVSSVEISQTNCQVNTLREIKENLGKIDTKLDRVHERIDDVLMRNKNQ